ncbi:hypothetical protein AWB75_02606 [Caballeronia catudaia]|uniref:Uncharacterized protein n=1 Tax=Caballeronia catudaia TaxID=1777136 RepID=A0A158AU45_9BURK|nr:hypothetical protein AWB75_02606 [Caballeronia catudaia]
MTTHVISFFADDRLVRRWRIISAIAPGKAVVPVMESMT